MRIENQSLVLAFKSPLLKYGSFSEDLKGMRMESILVKFQKLRVQLDKILETSFWTWGLNFFFFSLIQCR